MKSTKNILIFKDLCHISTIVESSLMICRQPRHAGFHYFIFYSEAKMIKSPTLE